MKNTLFSKMLSFLVGFGEFEESGPGDGVAVGVDHQVPATHHRQILSWEHRCYQPGHFTSQLQRKAWSINISPLCIAVSRSPSFGKLFKYTFSRRHHFSPPLLPLLLTLFPSFVIFLLNIVPLPALFPSLSPKTPLKTVSPLGEMTTRYDTWEEDQWRKILPKKENQTNYTREILWQRERYLKED